MISRSACSAIIGGFVMASDAYCVKMAWVNDWNESVNCLYQSEKLFTNLKCVHTSELVNHAEKSIKFSSNISNTNAQNKQIMLESDNKFSKLFTRRSAENSNWAFSTAYYPSCHRCHIHWDDALRKSIVALNCELINDQWPWYDTWVEPLIELIVTLMRNQWETFGIYACDTRHVRFGDGDGVFNQMTNKSQTSQ